MDTGVGWPFFDLYRYLLAPLLLLSFSLTINFLNVVSNSSPFGFALQNETYYIPSFVYILTQFFCYQWILFCSLPTCQNQTDHMFISHSEHELSFSDLNLLR